MANQPLISQLLHKMTMSLRERAWPVSLQNEAPLPFLFSRARSADRGLSRHCCGARADLFDGSKDRCSKKGRLGGRAIAYRQARGSRKRGTFDFEREVSFAVRPHLARPATAQGTRRTAQARCTDAVRDACTAVRAPKRSLDPAPPVGHLSAPPHTPRGSRRSAKDSFALLGG